MDKIFISKRLNKKIRYFNLETDVAFIYFEKAFDMPVINRKNS
jgi:hypothetical protein